MGFAVDHVWLVTPDAVAACEALSEATGLPVLRGWTPRGVVRSRGVRFANGPFLDVHDPSPAPSASPPPTVLLSGSLDEGARIAGEQGWRLKLQRRSEAPAEVASPWSLGFFSRRQGALSSLALIEYEIDPALCEIAEYAGPLLALDTSPAAGPRLNRVWIGAEADAATAANLAALGFTAAGEAATDGRTGRLFRHAVCDLVVSPGDDGPFRLEVSNAVAKRTLRLGRLEVACT